MRRVRIRPIASFPPIAVMYRSSTASTDGASGGADGAAPCAAADSGAERRHRRRLMRAMMAGRACHGEAALEAGPVDLAHHADHFPCLSLRGLVVAFDGPGAGVARHMAEGAFDAERILHEIHDRHDFGRGHALEDPDVLVVLLGRNVGCRRLPAFRGDERGREGDQQQSGADPRRHDFSFTNHFNPSTSIRSERMRW